MTTLTPPIPARPVASPLEHAILVASDRLAAFALARMQRRAAASGSAGARSALATRLADADDRRRTAAALGTLGILPR